MELMSLYLPKDLKEELQKEADELGLKLVPYIRMLLATRDKQIDIRLLNKK